MRTYDDAFSGQKIYPGKVRPTGSPTSIRPPTRIAIPQLRQRIHICGQGWRNNMTGKPITDNSYRASSTSVVIARSSASRMARPSPYSSSARTHARSPGQPFTDGSTRRVSLRLVDASSPMFWLEEHLGNEAASLGCTQSDIWQLGMHESLSGFILPIPAMLIG